MCTFRLHMTENSDGLGKWYTVKDNEEILILLLINSCLISSSDRNFVSLLNELLTVQIFNTVFKIKKTAIHLPHGHLC
jgi:hypothetical protein